MKHAGNGALDALEELLEKIRARAILREKKRGIFYYKGSAFLHFHEDAAGVFADVKIHGKYRRYPASGQDNQQKLLEVLAQALGKL